MQLYCRHIGVHVDFVVFGGFNIYFADGCEGLMVKTLIDESSYEPSKRSRNWLKVKKDYINGTGDSLDLVVIGGYYGRGKRTGVYGGFLLATYDEENEKYQAICKLGTGFSEADLETHSSSLREIVIDGPKPYYDISDGIRPDLWFEAAQVMNDAISTDVVARSLLIFYLHFLYTHGS